MDCIGSNIVRGKIWGNTSTLFAKNNVEMARIEVKPGGYCSEHCHQYKYNLFFVESGELEVIIFRNDADTTIEDVTTLKAGESTFVEPGLYHKFRAVKETIAYEIYWVEIDPQDIQRNSVGGMKHPDGR